MKTNKEKLENECNHTMKEKNLIIESNEFLKNEIKNVNKKLEENKKEVSNKSNHISELEEENKKIKSNIKKYEQDIKTLENNKLELTKKEKEKEDNKWKNYAEEYSVKCKHGLDITRCAICNKVFPKEKLIKYYYPSSTGTSMATSKRTSFVK